MMMAASGCSEQERMHREASGWLVIRMKRCMHFLYALHLELHESPLSTRLALLTLNSKR